MRVTLKVLDKLYHNTILPHMMEGILECSVRYFHFAPLLHSNISSPPSSRRLFSCSPAPMYLDTGANCQSCVADCCVHSKHFILLFTSSCSDVTFTALRSRAHCRVTTITFYTSLLSDHNHLVHDYTHQKEGYRVSSTSGGT